jgi:hypothetical protein
MGIFIYPNPTAGILTIESLNSYSEKTTIRILNTIGQTVYVTELSDFGSENQIDLSSLKNGVYMIEISSAKKIAVQRIIVEK